MKIETVISCAGKDKKLAEKLEEDLKAQRFDPWIYTEDMKPGKLWLEQVSQEFSRADIILGIITESYFSSFGYKEACVVISEQFNENNDKFIPLFFMPRKDCPDLFIKNTNGIDFIEDYNTGLKKLLEYLNNLKKEDSKELLSRVESLKSSNPFRYVRAEFFLDNYDLIARAFAKPEIYDILLEHQPTFIFGGRGCGKTMILKSLMPRVIFKRLKIANFSEAKSKGVDFFGVYFKLERGSLLFNDNSFIIEMGFKNSNVKKDYELYKKSLDELNQISDLNLLRNNPIIASGINSILSISINEINLKILKTILQELKELSENDPPFITIEQEIEEKITEKLCSKIGLDTKNIKNFHDLISAIDNELQKIVNYIQDMSIPFSSPKVNWIKTGMKFLDESLPLFSHFISDLQNTRFFLLFDEFENLLSIQQTIINDWIKTAKSFTLKIACKYQGMYTKDNLQGQPLQFGQDCAFPIELDYNLPDTLKSYKELLKKICFNLLEIEHYEEKDIDALLEEPEEPEFSNEIIDKKIEEIRITAKLPFDVEDIKNYRDKLQVSAVFRLLKENNQKKRYSSFETLSFISSGIIRVFLNLMGMSIYRAEELKLDIKNGTKIPVEVQTWAAYVVSRAWLEKIPDIYDIRESGELIYQFIVDLGNILRERLLNHPTEPETLCITIPDPLDYVKVVDRPPINDILKWAERESIIYRKKENRSVKPRNSLEPRNYNEYLINRIYCPILELSYRSKWGRNIITSKELSDLLNTKTRREAIKKLKRRINKEMEDRTNTSLYDFT